MSEETKTIEATAGAYKGQRLTMSCADADAAIADGWAVDPYAERDHNAKEPEPMTDEQREDVRKKADKAMRKLRGEPDEPPPVYNPNANQPAQQSSPEIMTTRDLAGDEPHKYRRK